MDRFVHTLNGEATETVVRTSIQAASTMKYDRILSLNEVSEAIERLMRDPSANFPQTYCGIPHNLFLPR